MKFSTQPGSVKPIPRQTFPFRRPIAEKKPRAPCEHSLLGTFGLINLCSLTIIGGGELLLESQPRVSMDLVETLINKFA